MTSGRLGWLTCLAVLGVCLVRQTAGQGHENLVESSFFNHTHGTELNGNPSLALGAASFTLSYTMNLNSSFNEPNTRLSVKLTPPFRDVTTNTGCKTYVTGLSCASTTITKQSFVSMSSAVSSLDIWVSNGVTVEKQLNTSSDHTIDIDFGLVSLNDPEPTIVITLTTSLTREAEEYTGGTDFTFSGELTATQGPATYTNTSELTYTLVRPVLQVSFTANETLLSSGTPAFFEVTIQHASSSTDTASNFVVSRYIFKQKSKRHINYESFSHFQQRE